VCHGTSRLGVEYQPRNDRNISEILKIKIFVNRIDHSAVISDIMAEMARPILIIAVSYALRRGTIRRMMPPGLNIHHAYTS
jgi:hypothetical protein